MWVEIKGGAANGNILPFASACTSLRLCFDPVDSFCSLPLLNKLCLAQHRNRGFRDLDSDCLDCICHTTLSLCNFSFVLLETLLTIMLC